MQTTIDVLQERFYTVDELANHLRVHPDTIRALIHAGKLRCLRVGAQYRIPLSEIGSLGA